MNTKIDYAYEIGLPFITKCFATNVNHESGLVWLRRPRSHFKTFRSYRTNCGRFSGKVVGTPKLYNKVPYWTCEVAGHKLLNHRIVWMLYNNQLIPEDYVIDHIDRNTLNNHPNNLRLANFSLSAANTKRPNKSGVTGCIFRPAKNGGSDSRPYQVGMRINNRTQHIGCYKTIEEANDAYSKAFESIHNVEYK